MGIEFRESSYTISTKCNKPVLNGMVFNLSIGFGGIPDPRKEGKT
jgi:nucleosome binding factor SPN SPT16 subunit